MTTAADTAAEKAFEALLAGRPVPPGTPGLGAVTAFTEVVRATATQPGRPNAALAELLANGLIVDQPSPSPRTANRRRRRMWFFSAIIAKIAGASAVAQAATGAGIVLVGFTGAGAAGVLPASVQHTFATVVSNVTPLTAPDPQPAADPTTPTATTTPSDTATTTATSTDATQAAASVSKPDGFDCDLTQSFGVCVSEHAKDGTLPAGGVSAWAQYFQAHRMDKAEQSDAQESADASESDSPDSPDVSAAPKRTSSASQSRHGHDSQGDHGGNGGDHGGGNGGNGGGDN